MYVRFMQSALATAEAYVIEGEQRIETQRRIVAQLQASHADTTHAERFLETLIEIQAERRARHRRLWAELCRLCTMSVEPDWLLAEFRRQARESSEPLLREAV